MPSVILTPPTSSKEKSVLLVDSPLRGKLNDTENLISSIQNPKELQQIIISIVNQFPESLQFVNNKIQSLQKISKENEIKLQITEPSPTKVQKPMTPISSKKRQNIVEVKESPPTHSAKKKKQVPQSPLTPSRQQLYKVFRLLNILLLIFFKVFKENKFVIPKIRNDKENIVNNENVDN